MRFLAHRLQTVRDGQVDGAAIRAVAARSVPLPNAVRKVELDASSEEDPRKKGQEEGFNPQTESKKGEGGQAGDPNRVGEIHQVRADALTCR